MTSLALVLSACAPSARQLSPSQTPQALRATMAQSLRKLPGWSVTTQAIQGKHEVLVLRHAASPQLVLLIDSAQSAADGSELAIQIRLDPSLRIPDAARNQLLAQLNAHHARNWAGTFFVDAQGSLLGQWTFNLPGRPLDVNFVSDAVLRIQESWAELESALRRAKLTAS